MFLGFPYLTCVVHSLTASCFGNPRTQHNCVCSSTRQVGLIIMSIYWHCPNSERFNLIPTHTRQQKTHRGESQGWRFLVPECQSQSKPWFSDYSGGRWVAWTLDTGVNSVLWPPNTGSLSPSLPQHEEWKFTCLWVIQFLFSPVVGKVPLQWTKFCFDPGSVDTGK